MKKPILVIAVLLVSIATLGCRERAPGGGRTESEHPVVIESVEGVRTIRNPGFSKEGVVRYALEEELSVGGESGGAEAVLNRPIDLRLDSQGNIYILDWGDVDIKVFAPDGRLLRTVGSKGQGPGQFEVPAYFTVTPDDRLILLASSQSKISILDTVGTYLSGFNVEGSSMALATGGRDRIYFSRRLRPEISMSGEVQKIETKMALYRADLEGKDLTMLGEFPDFVQLMKVTRSKEGAVVGGSISREAYKTSWLVGPDGRVYLGYNRDYLLDVYDSEWNLLFRFGREFTPLRHPEYKPEGAHPEFYPAFSDWRKFFDEDGNLWLEQYVAEGVEDHVFDVFSPEGIYLRQVRVPETLYLLRGGLAYTIVRDEEDFLLVKRFRMVRAED